MDFSIPTLFIVPPANTYPTAGSTNDLAGTTLGIFDQKYAALTAATAAAAKYIYVAQSRKVPLPGLGTKRSDKIFKDKVVEWYKVPGVSTVQNQVTTIESFGLGCDQTLYLTFRLFSNYIETIYANGLTKTLSLVGPCCGPTFNLKEAVDLAVDQINGDKQLSQFIIATQTGPADAEVLTITGKPLDKYGNPCLPTAFPYEYDKLKFDTWLSAAPATTQDYLPADRCMDYGKITVVTKSSYQTGHADEIYDLEKRYHSYQSTLKDIFENPAFNGGFERETIPGTYYTTYFLKFHDPAEHDLMTEALSESVTIAIPVGQEAGFEAIMTPYLGAPAIKAVV